MHGLKKIREESGAIVIEGALSLTIFIFALITIYSVFHICMAQSRISQALNESAKEISQYAYLYELTDLHKQQANLAAYGGHAETEIDSNLTQIDTFFDALKGIARVGSDFMSSPENAESFLYYALNKGINWGAGEVVGQIAKLMMKKHLGSDPNKFMKGLWVKDGLDGLSFGKTRFFSDGTEKNVWIDVQYQVVVVKLLNIDLTWDFELCAKTRAWVGDD